MSQMFEDADAFDGDVSTFKIGNVVNMQMMFRNAISFTGRPDLSLWNFSNVEEASEMFYGAVSFQGIGISWWNIDSLLSPNLMVSKIELFSLIVPPNICRAMSNSQFSHIWCIIMCSSSLLERKLLARICVRIGTHHF